MDLKRSDVASIAAHAAARNALVQVTGILMASGQVFFQVLEGPTAAIDDVIGRIARDPRHCDLLVLGTETDPGARFFPNWSMRLVDLGDQADARLEPARALLAQVHDLRQRLSGATQALERAIIGELTRAT
jgi:hypothetical protein